MFKRSVTRSLSAGAADFAELLGRSLPRRTNSSGGARRRTSEFNILGCADVVSTEYLLEKLKEAQAETRITKLELEDCVDREESVFAAVEEMLANDSQRVWRYIKFIDCIYLTDEEPGMDADSQLSKYSAKRQQLWDAISAHAEAKPIMFQVNLEVAAGTTLSSMRDTLQVLSGLNLARVRFGGVLSGARGHVIPTRLAEQFKCQSQDQMELSLQTTVMIDLFFAPIRASPTSANTSTISSLFGKCMQKLQALGTEADLGGCSLDRSLSSESFGDLSAVLSSSSSSFSACSYSVGRSKSRRKASELSTSCVSSSHSRKSLKEKRVSAKAKSSGPDYDWTTKRFVKPDYRWDKKATAPTTHARAA